MECSLGTFSNIVDPLDHSIWDCEVCPEGTYMDETGMTYCKLCPFGTYHSNTGMTAASDCIDCASNQMTEFEGSTSVDQCIDAPTITTWSFDKYNGELLINFDSEIFPASMDVTKLQFNKGRTLSTGPPPTYAANSIPSTYSVGDSIQVYVDIWAAATITNVSSSNHYDLTFDIDGETLEDVSWTMLRYPEIPTLSISNPANDISIQDNGTSIFIIFNGDDYSKILIAGLNGGLGSTEQELWMSLEAGFVRNLDNIPNNVVAQSDAIQAISFIPDSAVGQLREVSIDMNDGLLTLKFSKPVDVSSMRASELLVQDRETVTIAADGYGTTRGNIAYMVEGGISLVSMTDYRRTTVWSFGTTNMNTIKGILGLCTVIEKCFVAAQSAFIADVSGNLFSLPNFERLYAMQVASFTPDLTNPALTSWEFDYNTGYLFLNFDETVYAQYLNSSCIVMRANKCPEDACYTISDGTCDTSVNQSSYDSSLYNCMHTRIRVESPDIIPTENLAIMPIKLNIEQLNLLKNDNQIFMDASNSYLSIEPSVIVDTSYANNKYLGSVTATEDDPMAVGSLAEDITRPTVLYFDLDMDSRILTITMDEIVDISSINLNALILQAEQSLVVGVQSFLLSSQTCTVLNVGNSVQINILLLDSAFITLKGYSNLASRPSSTFLSVTNLFVKDTSPNANIVVPIADISSKAIRNFYPDRSRPYLTSWNIDMSYNRLTMIFSENMDTSDGLFNYKALRLQTDLVAVPSTLIHKITTGSSIYAAYDNYVVVQLGPVDSNTIKSTQPLCTAQDKCYLVADEGIGFDTPTFDINNVVYRNEFIAAASSISGVFTPDTLPPRLVSYQIDMSLATISIVFSEPINTRTFSGVLNSIIAKAFFLNSHYPFSTI